MAVFNGFHYPHISPDLPKLDLISERLISPRLPFMQIRRLRHFQGQYGIYGQVINVPVCVNNMVTKLPRAVDDDCCINIHIKRHLIRKSIYLHGLVRKNVIKSWLTFLIQQPLYKHHNIRIDKSFLDDNNLNENISANGNTNLGSSNFDREHDITTPNIEEYSKDIPLDEILTAQQQTLLWNEDKYLQLASGEKSVPYSLFFDEHAEELSFPSIYLGEFRKFREGIYATPFRMATSELRRIDRRGVTPHHLLYLAMKILRLRVRDSLTVAFKHVGKDTAISYSIK